MAGFIVNWLEILDLIINSDSNNSKLLQLSILSQETWLVSDTDALDSQRYDKM